MLDSGPCDEIKVLGYPAPAYEADRTSRTQDARTAPPAATTQASPTRPNTGHNPYPLTLTLHMRYWETSPSRIRSTLDACCGFSGAGAIEYAVLSALIGEPNVDVLPGGVSRPLGHVEHGGLDAKRLLNHALDRRNPPRGQDRPKPFACAIAASPDACVGELRGASFASADCADGCD
jgi:hypothetical protein